MIENYLEHFKQIWDAPSSVYRQHTEERWDERAGQWESELRDDAVVQDITRKRIDAAVRFLTYCGALEPGFRVMDIGCGPGRFVAEFAKRVHLAEGTDFSGAMLEYASSFCKEKGIHNVDFTKCDFLKADVGQLGWTGQFDLVYSSMTPAMSRFSSLEKMIAMSRAFCCSSCCIIGHSSVQDVIAAEAGPERVRPMWDGTWFYSLLNLVWDLGYFPWTDYYTLTYTTKTELTRELVKITLSRMLHGQDMRHSDAERAYSVLMEHAENGVIEETCTNWYGAIAWDVRNKTQRW